MRKDRRGSVSKKPSSKSDSVDVSSKKAKSSKKPSGRDVVKKKKAAASKSPQTNRDKMKQKAAEDKKVKESNRYKIKETASKSGKKKVKFVRTKMWLNLLLSALQKDRGKIPNNIGDRILITNNMYITRYFLCSIISVDSLSLKTPITLVGEVNEALRRGGSHAVCDVIFKNEPFEVKLKDSGLLSRINMWENALSHDDVPDREKETAARCLYTVDQATAGVPLMRTRIFIKVMAKTGTELTAAEDLIYKFLNSIDATYTQVVGNVKEVLQYISVLSDLEDKKVKEYKSVINSPQTLSQMLPNSGSFNESKGSYIANNILNNSQFMLDWKDITIARNVYVCAPSGVGKTVLALNMCCSAREDGMAVCIQDIKGNEFNNFVNGTGGYIVSMRQTSSGYINSWKMEKDDTDDFNAEMYFKNRVNFSKEQIIILSGITNPEDKMDLEELLDNFHEALYINLGVLPSNRNSWDATKVLDPYMVYDMLVDYMSPTMQARYSNVSKKVLNTLRMTMNRNGSKSYLFKEEFDYISILRAPTLMFDFGILEGATDLSDTTIFKLKFAYMRKLNAEYTAYKYSKGIKVFKVLEESQIAVNDKDIMKGYVEEFTLRRAQGQTTLLLGNSVSALLDNVISKPLVENAKGLLIGYLPKEARELVIEKFGLEDYTDLLNEIGKDAMFSNSFLFVNNMQDRPVIPILKVMLDGGKKYKLFTPVAQNNNYTV